MLRAFVGRGDIPDGPCFEIHRMVGFCFLFSPLLLQNARGMGISRVCQAGR